MRSSDWSSYVCSSDLKDVGSHRCHIHHASRAEATAHRRAGSLLASAARPAYPFVTTRAPRKGPSLAGRTAGMKDVKRAWQRMLSGRRLDLLDPSPLDIELEDIAHGLARVARWNGQTSGDAAFSVAQHSLLVDEIGRAPV